jgi:hypothetical protein
MYLVDCHAEPELYPSRKPLHLELGQTDHKDRTICIGLDSKRDNLSPELNVTLGNCKARIERIYAAWTTRGIPVTPLQHLLGLDCKETIQACYVIMRLR